MDILSIIGLVLALNAILVGAVLKGAGLMALVSAAAFMIVVVGTCAAICIQTPLEVMQRALKIFPWIMRPPVRDGRLLIAKIVEWSNIARKQGLLGLEMMIEREPDDFVHNALRDFGFAHARQREVVAVAGEKRDDIGVAVEAGRACPVTQCECR